MLREHNRWLQLKGFYMLPGQLIGLLLNIIISVVLILNVAISFRTCGNYSFIEEACGKSGANCICVLKRGVASVIGAVRCIAEMKILGCTQLAAAVNRSVLVERDTYEI